MGIDGVLDMVVDEQKTRLLLENEELKKKMRTYLEKYEEMETGYGSLKEDRDILNDNLRIMSVELIQLRFDNRILIEQLNSMRMKQNISKDDFILPSVNDVPFNYNTKQNYVDVLHENIISLQDKLEITGIHKTT